MALRKRRERNWFESDDHFNQLYPPAIHSLSRDHWTPLSIAERAAGFLAEGGRSNILDIGCGVGKFCLVAAFHYPHNNWFGIDQRANLITYAQSAKEIVQLENVFFRLCNFTQVNFTDFDHFYFYNSFGENLDPESRIDDTIAYSGDLYDYYTRYLRSQLDSRSPGARVATLDSMGREIPLSYREVGSAFGGRLKLWIKSS